MIYFIQGKDGTPIKVGYTADRERLLRRIASIQTGYPYLLRAVATIDAGPRSLERQIHEILSPDRLSGEWFEANPRAATLAKCIMAFPNFEEALAHYRTVEKDFQHLIGTGAGMLAETVLMPLFEIPSKIFQRLRTERDMPARCLTIKKGSRLQRYYPVQDAIAWARRIGRLGERSMWAVRHSAVPVERLRHHEVISGLVAETPGE